VVIIGVATNNSVEATARSGGNLGFKTIVVADAASTFDQRDINGRLWPAEDVHALSPSNLAADYASIFISEEAINDLECANQDNQY
jgi:nicotinamidase-related amidase